MKLLCEQLSALRDYAGAEIGSPFSDRSSPTFSAALGQFIKTWAMFGAVPNGPCIQTHVQYQSVTNSEGFHTSLCFGNTCDFLAAISDVLHDVKQKLRYKCKAVRGTL